MAEADLSNLGNALIPIARSAISSAFGKPDHYAREDYPWLQEHGASFVTLVYGKKLRGCIGTFEFYRPLLGDLKSNALAAPFLDSRFKTLAEHELQWIKIKISLLSPMQQIFFTDEQDALAQLQPNIDGVVFEYGCHRSTFLPQV